MEQETQKVVHGLEALQYPIFRCLALDMDDDEWDGMRHVVCGWMFGNYEMAQA